MKNAVRTAAMVHKVPIDRSFCVLCENVLMAVCARSQTCKSKEATIQVISGSRNFLMAPTINRQESSNSMMAAAGPETKTSLMSG